MSLDAEYLRQDYWVPDGRTGIEVGRGVQPPPTPNFIELFNIVRTIKRPPAAKCLGEPRLDLFSIKAFYEYEIQLPVDPPPPPVKFGDELRVAYLLRVVDPMDDKFERFNPQDPTTRVEQSIHSVELLESGVWRGALPGFGTTFWPSLPRPMVRRNVNPLKDFSIQIWAGVRGIDFPDPPAGQVLSTRVKWNCYLRHGWYFPRLSRRGMQCCDVANVGGVLPSECEP